MTVADWPHVFRPGESDTPVFVLLHGTGGNENDITVLAAHLDPRAGVLAPRGRVLEQGMTRWFRRRAEGVFDVDDVQLRADELAEFVGDAVAEYGLGGRRLIAVGMSNGANIALATGMRHPELFAGVVAFSGMYPFGDRTFDESLAALNVVLLNGSDDPMAPSDSVRMLAGELERRGAAVTRAEREGGHGITQADLNSALRWLVGA